MVLINTFWSYRYDGENRPLRRQGAKVLYVFLSLCLYQICKTTTDKYHYSLSLFYEQELMKRSACTFHLYAVKSTADRRWQYNRLIS